MTSYVKCISYGRWIGDANCLWGRVLESKNPDLLGYIRTLNSMDQLRFALDQTLALSYFFWLNGPHSHELAVSYSQVIKEFTDNAISKNNYTGAYAKIYQILLDIQRCWYGADWIDVPIKDLGIFLYQLIDKELYNRIPVATSPNSIVPYLMQRNHKVQEGFEVFAERVAVPTFSFTTGGLVNSWCILRYCESPIGTNFVANEKVKFKGLPDYQMWINNWKRNGLTFLVMLAKVDVYTKHFESILRDLAMRVVHTDPYVDVSENHRLFYATHCILDEVFSADFLSIARDNGTCKLENVKCEMPNVRYLYELLGLLNGTQKVIMSSRELFVKFFRAWTKQDKTTETKQIVEYVAHSGTNVASAEEKAAFDRSPLGSCEAIDLISQNPVIAQDAGTDETEEIQEDDDGDNLDLSDLPERDDAKPGLEADDVDEKDQDTSTDADEGEDDPSSQDGDQGDESANSNSGEEGDSSAAASGDVAASSTGNDTQTSGTPEDLDASDNEGIVFKVVPEGSETVDSVVFREEIDNFITDVLTNPPKKLSPQAVNALTTLQKNWLHILSVESITGILEKIIALPDKFKKIKDSKGKKSK